jgi:hypothetical protein
VSSDLHSFTLLTGSGESEQSERVIKRSCPSLCVQL